MWKKGKCNRVIFGKIVWEIVGEIIHFRSSHQRFYKKKCCWKFRKILWKTPLSDPLFDKFAGWKLVFFLWILRAPFFTQYLHMTAFFMKECLCVEFGWEESKHWFVIVVAFAFDKHTITMFVSFSLFHLLFLFVLCFQAIYYVRFRKYYLYCVRFRK